MGNDVDAVVKNPFAIRDGQIITINDIPSDENGLRCNCFCPHCKGSFEARMGKVRTWHFAHTTSGCDAELAYLSGLYEMLRSFILSEPVNLPELDIYFRMSRYQTDYLDAANLRNRISFCQEHDDCVQVAHYRESRIKFETAEIIKSGSNERPVAVEASVGGKTLAFVITPPDTVCKDYYPKAYKECSTVEVGLRDYGERIVHADRNRINELLRDRNLYRWLWSNKAENCIDNVNAIIDKHITACKKAEEEKQKRDAEEEFIRKARSEEEARKEAEKVAEKKKQEEQEKEEAERRRAELLVRETDANETLRVIAEKIRNGEQLPPHFELSFWINRMPPCPLTGAQLTRWYGNYPKCLNCPYCGFYRITTDGTGYQIYCFHPMEVNPGLIGKTRYRRTESLT